MPVTHLTLANKLRSLDPEAYDQLLGEIKAMTEPSVEEIVVKAEQGWSLGNEDTLRLIASWRKRGAVLGHARQAIVREYPAHSQYGTKAALLDKIDAALKDKP